MLSLPHTNNYGRCLCRTCHDGGLQVLMGNLASFDMATAEGAPAGWQGFDFVVCTQVFEHVEEPAKAAARLLQLVRPGGRVFFSVPFMATQHRVPADNYRYTLEGAARLVMRAGFEVERAWVYGDALLSFAYNWGYGTRDFSEAEVAAQLREVPRSAWQQGVPIPHDDDRFYVLAVMMLKRPGPSA